MSANYFLVKINGVVRAHEEPISALCFDFGALGVSETLKFTQTNLEYEPEIIETPFLNLEVYFSNPPRAEFFEELKLRFPDVQTELLEEEEKDWLAEWKKGFVAFSLVKDIWIVPSWLTPPDEAGRVISMDPGMAFGTGTHETTQLAAKLLWNLSQNKKLKSLLDIGTGTGVLSILAEHLGFNAIDATEIDPVARRVGAQNVERNRCHFIKVLDQQVQDLTKSYDVVVANIIDGVLIRISKDLKARVKKEGYLILTGVLEERASEFLDEFLAAEKNEFEVLQADAQGEWHGFLLRRLR